jgi:hypothetical protein
MINKFENIHSQQLTSFLSQISFYAPKRQRFVTCLSECFPWNMRKFDSTAQTYMRNLVQSLVIYKLLLNLIELLCYTSDKSFLNNSWLFHACNNCIVYRKAISNTDAHCKHSADTVTVIWNICLFVKLRKIVLITLLWISEKKVKTSKTYWAPHCSLISIWNFSWASPKVTLLRRLCYPLTIAFVYQSSHYLFNFQI